MRLSTYLAQTGTPPPIQRGGWLDALRFIVAAMIIIHHFQLAAPVPLVEFHPVFERGYLLTNFFIIDSGYVLTRLYGKSMARGQLAPGQFLRQRFSRVIPAHLIVSLGLAAIVLAATSAGLDPRHPEWFDWSQYPAQLFLVQSYGVPGGLGWNAPTWTLSALLGCYVAFPVLARVFSRLGGFQLLLVGVGIFTIANFFTWAVLGYPVYQMPLAFGFLRALPLFACGILLGFASERVFVPPRAAAILGIGAAVALATLQYFDRHSVASLALICSILFAVGAIPVRSASPIAKTGALIAYSMFLTNEVVRITWFGVVNVLDARFSFSEGTAWGLWAIGVGFAFAVAVVFYRFVDAPTQRWLASRSAMASRRKIRSPDPAPATTAQESFPLSCSRLRADVLSAKHQ